MGWTLTAYDEQPADEVVALDYRETAPADAHRDMFLDEKGEPDAQLSIHSPLASGVPGTVRGMAALHERYGSLPWPELVQPAIDLAENGFRIDPWTANKIQEYGEKFALVDPRFREHIEFQLYFREGVDRMAIPDLAATLRRIAGQGADEFYTGRTSELIVEEMQGGGGLITAADLAAWSGRAPEAMGRLGTYQAISKTMLKDPDKALEMIERALASESIPPRIARSCERLAERLRRPVRVGLLGYEPDQRAPAVGAAGGHPEQEQAAQQVAQEQHEAAQYKPENVQQQVHA